MRFCDDGRIEIDDNAVERALRVVALGSVPHRGSSDQAHRGVVPVERRKSTTSQPRGGINEDAATNVPFNSLPELPYIEETIENGGITIGIIPPLSECVAVAHEGRHTLAMLKRQKGESLAQLLYRLDLAIARAHTDDIFTDEINPQSK
jgi:hypothetical protein